jgi:hypothetical protein
MAELEEQTPVVVTPEAPIPDRPATMTKAITGSAIQGRHRFINTGKPMALVLFSPDAIRSLSAIRYFTVALAIKRLPDGTREPSCEVLPVHPLRCAEGVTEMPNSAWPEHYR